MLYYYTTTLRPNGLFVFRPQHDPVKPVHGPRGPARNHSVTIFYSFHALPCATLMRVYRYRPLPRMIYRMDSRTDVRCSNGDRGA